MNSKKLTVLLIILVVALAILFSVLKFSRKEPNNIQEYTPEEEISEKQNMQTLVTLYFNSNENENLLPEARLIDAKSLIENPYRVLVELLIAGPKNERVTTNIPKRYDCK